MSYFDLGVRLMIDTMPCGNTAALAAYERQQDMWDAAHRRRDADRRERIAEQVGNATLRDVDEWGQQNDRVPIAACNIAAAVLRGDVRAEGVAKQMLLEMVIDYLTNEFDKVNPIEDYL